MEGGEWRLSSAPGRDPSDVGPGEGLAAVQSAQGLIPGWPKLTIPIRRRGAAGRLLRMTPDPDTSFIPIVLRTIAWLLAMLGAPARAWKRFAGYDWEKRFLLEKTLQAYAKRGIYLRYEGDDDATVEKRLRMLERFIENPGKALRHLARLARAGVYIFSVPERALEFASPGHAPRDDVRPADLCVIARVAPDSS